MKLNAADIHCWIREEEAKANKAGIGDFVIKVTSDTVLACGFIDGVYWARSGSTTQEAVSALRALMPAPEEKAKQLREQARKLLREAVELEIANGGVR